MSGREASLDGDECRARKSFGIVSGQGNLRDGDRGVRALLLPVSEFGSCRVVRVEDSSTAFSDVIGGGLLLEAFHGRVEEPESGDADWFCLCTDEEAAAKGFPLNERVGVLAARLGCIEELRTIEVRGSVLVVGMTESGWDVDIPAAVLRAAWRGGLLPRPPTSLHRRSISSVKHL